MSMTMSASLRVTLDQARRHRPDRRDQEPPDHLRSAVGLVRRTRRIRRGGRPMGTASGRDHRRRAGPQAAGSRPQIRTSAIGHRLSRPFRSRTESSTGRLNDSREQSRPDNAASACKLRTAGCKLLYPRSSEWSSSTFSCTAAAAARNSVSSSPVRSNSVIAVTPPAPTFAGTPR